MSATLKKALQFTLFVGLGVGVLWLVFRSQNAAFQEQCRLDQLEKLRQQAQQNPDAALPKEYRLEDVPVGQCSLVQQLLDDFSSVHYGWLLMVAAGFTLSVVFRARRWQMLLEPVGHQVSFANSFWTIILGYFANLGFPRMGEVVRAGSLSRYERISFEKVMGTLVTDRLMDFVCLGVVVGLAFIFQGQVLWEYIESRRQATQDSGGLLAQTWVQVVLGIGAVMLLLTLVLWKKIIHLTFVQRVLNLFRGFWDGLRSVFRLKNPGLFLLYSGGIWLMFFLQCWFNLKAFPPTSHLGAGAAIMIFVFSTLGMVAPSPGGMGTFHATTIAGLALYGIYGSDAFSYAMIAFFAIQIFYNIVAGLIALLVLPAINKKPAA